MNTRKFSVKRLIIQSIICFALLFYLTSSSVLSQNKTVPAKAEPKAKSKDIGSIGTDGTNAKSNVPQVSPKKDLASEPNRTNWFQVLKREKPAVADPKDGIQKQGATDLNEFSLVSKILYPESAKLELDETDGRRFEIVFIVTLPFTSLLSFIVLQSATTIIYDDPLRDYTVGHMVFTGLNSIFLSSYIAYRDMQAWQRYKAKHLKSIEYLKPQAQLPAIERKYEFQLGLYLF